MKEKEAKSKGKKPIFKKWWFWVLIVIILFSAFGGTAAALNCRQKRNSV